jgi:hypothetical protein
MRLVGHVASMGEGRNVYRVLLVKPEGKKQLERPRHRWEDGIKLDLGETGWGVCVEWISCLKDIHNATQIKKINIKNRVSNTTFILKSL